jgi:signal transduction histidine kinase
LNLPIRARLTALYCIAFCLGAAALETGAYAALKLAVYAIADRDLNARLNGVEEFLGEHLPRLPVARVQKEIKTHLALQPDFLRIADENGPAIFEAPALASFAEERDDTSPRVWTAGRAGQPLRILAARGTIHGTDYHLLLASDLTAPFEVVRRFGLLLLLSSPILIGAAAVVGHWTAGRALEPVLAITRAARTIDAADLSRRIAMPESRDELRYLAETLNGMLARIETAFRKTVELTANASHELRTPLAVIRATAEVALMRGPGSKSDSTDSDRAALRLILREAERNTALLEDLLRLARADSGTVSLHLNAMDLTETFRVICQRCDPLAAKRALNLRFLPAPEPVWVSGDEKHLKSLLLILLDNAIKYTPAGGSVEVSLQSSTAEHAICRVKDTGIGISEADLPHVFERFFRSDRVRSREEGGSGLGLAIADWIVRTHNGSIEVESVLGSGSTFRMVLPRLPQPPEESFNRYTVLQGEEA